MAIATAPQNNLATVSNGLPNICGWESDIAAVVNHQQPIFLSKSNIDIEQIQAGFACALHMHQPTIPAGSNGELINNLQNMFEHPDVRDNHNAGVFAWC